MGWTELVIVDWGAVDDAYMAEPVGRLLELGVDVLLVAPRGTGSFAPPVGPAGRLFVWSGEPPVVRPAGAGGPAVAVEPGVTPRDWAGRWLAGPGAVAAVAELGALAGLDEVLAGADALADPSWLLEVEDLDPARVRHVESWLAVGNGRTGTRGSIEEGGPGSLAALYVAGLFGWDPAEQAGPELMRGPEWTRLQPRAGDEPVGLGTGDVLEHRRTLDMRRGLLHRQWRQRLPTGEAWDFRSSRFASLDDRRLLVLEAVADCEGQAVTLGGQMPVPAVEGAVEAVEARVRGAHVAVSMKAKGGGDASFEVSTQDEPGRLRRTVSVHPGGHAEPGPEVGPVERLRARHQRAWRERWLDADVVVDGDPSSQRALRFALYHLISAGDPESDRASIGARAMTGPGYRGHVFWDTEIFVLPFFIWTHPETARALLAYRYRTLPGARAKAARLGYEGALYAWESADTGEETTPEFVWLPDGHRLTILTGVQEHHIAADVAWAVWQYRQVTGDDGFLIEMGAEMLLETARFWASRAAVGEDGRHHICGVIGPDEYHEGIDDNAYTNVMARWNLETAASLFELLPDLDGPAWEALSARLRLDPAECRRWLEVAAGLVDGFDPATLLYEQFAGFFALEDVRAVDLAPRPFTGEMVVGVERLRRTQVVKQADVLMLALLLPDLVGTHMAVANYGYYEPRTSHGSSLSPAIHSLIAARLGALEDAERYFGLAAGIDLDDRMGNAADGVHIATMGGLWQAAVFGFGGARADGDALRLDPRLPASWPGMAFPVRWRGVRVHVAVSRDAVTVDLDGPARLAMGTGAPTDVGPGRVVSRLGGDGWSAPGPA